jgi:hypothetical protein
MSWAAKRLPKGEAEGSTGADRIATDGSWEEATLSPKSKFFKI